METQITLQIERRESFADAMSFGTAGAYELLQGCVYFATDPELSIDSETISCHAGEYVAMSREWSGAEEVKLTLNCAPRLTRRPGKLFAMKRGPLLFSVPVGESWRRQTKSETDDSPWLNNSEVLPTTPWNFALCLDDESTGKLSVDTAAPGEMPFSPAGAPLSIEVPVRSVERTMDRGAATRVPAGTPHGEASSVRMIPYGCTNRRITEMPLCEVD